MGRWPARPNTSAMRLSRDLHALNGSSGCSELRTVRGDDPTLPRVELDLKRRSTSMTAPDTLRYTKIPLAHGSGAIPALGFGTLISDPVATRQATKTALEVGFRHFDCAERYRNEQAVGDAIQEVFKGGRFSGRMCSSPRSSGITIIVLSGSNPPSRRVASDSNSTTSIAISSIPPLPSNRATSRTRGTSAARLSLILG
jgi:hypothetical protein